LVLRQFCHLYAERVPDDTTLLRWANLIQPSPVHTLLHHIVYLAQQLNLTKGRKVYIDGTVVETNIRYPIGSTLLGDGIRVLTRVLRRAKHLVGTMAEAKPDIFRDIFRDRTRSARRDMKILIDTARQRGEEAASKLKTAYTMVLSITQAVVSQAKKAIELLKRKSKCQWKKTQKNAQMCRRPT
jgi:IS5 family transposase